MIPALLGAVLVLTLLPARAHAYIDPGAGSIALQIFLATLVAGLFALKTFFRRIVAFFFSIFSRGPRSGDDGR